MLFWRSSSKFCSKFLPASVESTWFECQRNRFREIKINSPFRILEFSLETPKGRDLPGLLDWLKRKNVSVAEQLLKFFPQDLQIEDGGDLQNILGEGLFTMLVDQLHLLQRREEMLISLADKFPVRLEVELAKDILSGKMDIDIKRSIAYDGQAFNVSYKGKSFFDEVSRRIIYLLSYKQARGLPALNRIMGENGNDSFYYLFAWLGLTRAVIDASAVGPIESTSETFFGKCMKNGELIEPWGRSITGI